MADNKMRKICAGLVLCMSLASLTGCGGSSDEENTDNSVMGRLTAISSSKITMDVMDWDNTRHAKEERPDTVSGGGVKIGEKDREKRKGTPPNDEKLQEAPPSDGEKPQGTPPAKKGETKTFELNSDTKIYKQSGEEKVEITLDEVELGTWLIVSLEENVVTSMVVQDSSQFGRRGNSKQDEK